MPLAKGSIKRSNEKSKREKQRPIYIYKFIIVNVQRFVDTFMYDVVRTYVYEKTVTKRKEQTSSSKTGY